MGHGADHAGDHGADRARPGPRAVAPSPSRVGLTGIETTVRIAPVGGGRPQPFAARIDCFVDIGAPRTSGAPVPRFDEVITEVTGEVVLGEPEFRAEQLARRIAERVRERQDARRAEVTISARYPEDRPAPVSGIRTQEIYTLHGWAGATAAGTRRVTGVTVQGITAAPDAQRAVAGEAARRLRADGFPPERIERILAAVPVATHDQRGVGSLYVGARANDDTELDALTLVNLVESSMSSAIYELMKRSDEGAVVDLAHRRARLPEDCVRATLAAVVERFPDLDGGHFVLARHENLETIHAHAVVAERYGLLSEIRAEVAGGGTPRRFTSLAEWRYAEA
jgi:GTP cyclohydrolase I/GTP cyclohydrolase-4